MIVILNNGARIRVAKDFVREIFKDLTGKPLSGRGWFCSIAPADDTLQGFNMDQVSAIVDEEDIL